MWFIKLAPFVEIQLTTPSYAFFNTVVKSFSDNPLPSTLSTFVAFITICAALIGLLISLVLSTFDKPTCAFVITTAPICPLTEVTKSGGVNNSCQLAGFDAGKAVRIKVLFISVLTAISPVSAVDASMDACVATTKVSVIPKVGN